MTTICGNNRLTPFLLLPVLVLTSLEALAGASAHRSSWTPTDGAPPARMEASGVVAFPCQFTPANDRCAWDAPRPSGLDSVRRLELTLSCDNPDAVRGVTVYLRSGDGWYAAPLPVPSATPGSVSLTAASFIEEGKPGGWEAIDSIRLAVWKRAEGKSALRLHALSTVRDRVFVIQADASVPPEEKWVAVALAKRLSAWLTRAGIGHALLPENEWIRMPPAQTRFALLPYNPRPTPAFFSALDAILDRGGKLLVCYGASPQLAERMGFQLSSFKPAPAPLSWSAYRFYPAIGPVTRVLQESPHLIPALPASPDASVLAFWEDGSGKKGRDAAWLASPAGYWTTHTLEPDDAALKTRVLLEWIGQSVPEAWEQAGAAALARAAAALPAQEVVPLKALAASRNWKQLVDESARLLASGAARQAAALPAAPAAETAAVWAQPGAGLMPEDWPRVGKELSQAGIRRVYLAAILFGRAYAESAKWPRAELAAASSDPFGASLKAAREAGLQVHAWVGCFNVAYAPPARMTAWRLGGRLMQTPAGEQAWLTPTHPDNAALLLDGIADLAARYPVDGIHLDYVRFPDGGLDISPCALRGFEAASGIKLARGQADVLPGGPRHADYVRWLTGTLDAFVAAVRKRLREVRPALVLTAAVYPAYPYCKDGVLQDWRTWLEKDSVDAVCPMSYTADAGQFAAFLEAYRAMPGLAGRIYPGIGIFSDSPPLALETVIGQVGAARAAGGPGTVFFLANREFMRDYAPALQPALD